VHDPPMTFTILSGRWDGNTGCPAKSPTKGGNPNLDIITGRDGHTYIGIILGQNGCLYIVILMARDGWIYN
jgi:hypothetical protein